MTLAAGQGGPVQQQSYATSVSVGPLPSVSRMSAAQNLGLVRYSSRASYFRRTPSLAIMAISGATVSAQLFEDGATVRIAGALYRSFLHDGSETSTRP